MTNDSGMEVKKQSVPSIGGDAQIVETAHVNDATDDVASYPENPMSGDWGESEDMVGIHPGTGTDVGEATNPLKP